MKNILIICLFTSGILMSCTEKKNNNPTDNQLSTQEIQEVQTLETENKTLDEIQNEIEKSSDELDAILKEIDK